MRRILILLALLCFPALASAQEFDDDSRYFQRRSLEGVKSFDVGVWPAPEGLSRAGITADEVERATLRRLKEKGLPALKFRPDLDSHLSIMFAATYDKGRKLWAVSVRVEFDQMGKIDRTGQEHAVPTWIRVRAVLTDATFKEAREALAALLDEFAKDFILANA